jgi:hypothetical protein
MSVATLNIRRSHMATFNANRTFGTEIEVITSATQGMVANAINDFFQLNGINNRCEAQAYNHNDQAIWKVVADGSLQGQGWEVVSPPMAGADGKAQLESVCQALNAIGATVSDLTGLHVHHDAADLTGQAIARVYATYAAHQEVLNFMVSPSRRSNHMLRPLSYAQVTNGGRDNFAKNTRRAAERKLQDRLGGMGMHSYTAVDTQSLSRHGTIEFRQHQGTINAEKIWNWVLLTQSIVEAASTMTKLPKQATGNDSRRNPFGSFKRAIKLNVCDNGGNPAAEVYQNAFKFWAKRFKHFCRQANVNPNTLERV